jgi:hypothetical protein
MLALLFTSLGDLRYAKKNDDRPYCKVNAYQQHQTMQPIPNINRLSKNNPGN